MFYSVSALNSKSKCGSAEFDPSERTSSARGKSNKEIGSNLFISETTVKGHLRNIFTKLNVLSRTEAVSVPSRRGLVQL